MEVKKYNPFVVIKPKPTGSTRERSLKPKPKPKVRPKAKIKLEDIIYAKGFVKTSKK